MPGGKSAQQSSIEFAPGKRRRQLLQIDGGEISLQPAGDHVPRQLIGRPLPQRKQRLDAGAGELGHAIGADILEKQIAEDDGADAVGFGRGERLGHARLVDVIRARIGNAHDDRRQSGGGELRLQNCLAHAMHADAREGIGHRGERTDNIVFAGAARFVQRPGAVLAARPGDQRFRPGGHQRQPEWGMNKRRSLGMVSEFFPCGRLEYPKLRATVNFMANES